MLSMDEKNFIKSLDRDGYTKTKISEITQHSRTTIRKVLTEPCIPEMPYVRRRNTTGTSYYSEIREMLEANATVKSRKNRLTAKRVFELLKAKHLDLEISLRTVERLVTRIKVDLKLNRQTRYLRLEHPPAEAQLDFGEIAAFVGQKERKLAMLVISFPHSNARWGVVLPGQNFECLAYGMRRIFEHIGFVPTVICFDNMSTAVSKVLSLKDDLPEDKEVYDALSAPRILNADFRRLMGHYGFKARFCRPAKGNEKGSVENAVGFLRRNVFVPLVSADSIEELNTKHLLPACEHYLKDKHYKHRDTTIEALFEEDRAHGYALREVEFDGSTYRTCTVDKYGEITVDTNRYPVPNIKPLSQVVVRLTHNQVMVTTVDSEVLITHDRLYERNVTIVDWEEEIKLLKQRPRAFRNSCLAKLMRPEIVDMIDRRNFEFRRTILDEAQAALGRNRSIDEIVMMLEKGIELGTYQDSADELVCRYRILEDSKTMPQPRLSEDDKKARGTSLSMYAS